ncbi:MULTISPECIES: triple tyrosine motif-containing protein [Metabacillus]|uniref:Transglycosylase SLT domain-containing protein n=1 Tax=Metabacillus elymi TaxID=2745198 RepID=A0ABX6S0V5_9BACI|nr:MULTISPECIES: triple tyrosine motif-containing protein [Metabacillus]QNF27363.1 transglycosylase SLT domain-containing protein [Metabacillus sp. KUDC1714]
MKQLLLRVALLTCVVLCWYCEEASAAPVWASKCSLYGELQQIENPSFQHLNCLLTNAAINEDIPPEVVKAVVTQESSGWKQFENGEPIISEDGGIGLMQITNTQEGYDKEKLKYDIYYNIEAGVEILSSMYTRNDLPTIIGAGRKEIENWYFPVMAYNGTKPVNSPLYQETGDENTGAYQEKVFTHIEEDSFLEGTKLAQYPFKTTDFKYETDSDDNIVFLKKEYTLTDPLHQSNYHFKAGDNVIVTRDEVRLRQQPGGDNIVSELARNTSLVIKGNFTYDQSEDSKNQFVWYPVSTEDQSLVGYVSSSYLMEAVHIDKIDTNVSSPQEVNKAINISVVATGGTEKLYKFFLNDGTGWKVLRDYSTNNVYEWVPEKAGDYQVSVYVKDRNSTKEQDDFKITNFKITEPIITSVKLNSVTTNLSSPQQVNKEIQINAEATGGTEKLYKFYLYDGTGWKVLRDYSTNNVFKWVPVKSGDYQISVYVKDRNSTKEQDDFKIIPYKVTEPIIKPVEINSVTTNLLSPQQVNKEIQINAEATGGTEKLYKFYLHDGTGWKVLRDYSTDNVYKWVPAKPGDYQVSVYVKDRNSTKEQDDFKLITFKITEPIITSVKLNSVTTSLSSPQQVNKEIQINAEATGGTEKLYKFYLHDGTGWKVLRDYSTNNVYKWVPTKPGDYQVSVYVKDRNSTKEPDDFKVINYSIQN